MIEMSFQHYMLGLFAVANNISAIPLFLSLCEGLSEKEQKKLGLTATLTAFLTMAVAMFTGSAILNFFEISINAFRIAGGLLLMITGLSMMKSDAQDSTQVNSKGFSEKISAAVIPIGIPLTTGAGTISTVILFAEKLESYSIIMKLSGAIACMTVIIYLLFRYSTSVVKYLGHTGLNVVTKIFGLITLALGIQFILTGLTNTFPGLMTGFK
jgi:multiple antibiotic resistance protein